MRRVVRGQLDRLVHPLEQPPRHPPVAPTDERDAHAALVQFVPAAHEDRLVEAHEVPDLVDRTPPVLGGERVHGEPAARRARARLRPCRTAPPRQRHGPRCGCRPRSGPSGRCRPSRIAMCFGMRLGSRPSSPTSGGTAAPATSPNLPPATASVTDPRVAVPSRWPESSAELDRSSPRSRLAANVARGNVRWPTPSRTAIANKRHLVVQAGTGTGKTLAYLVPAIVVGQRRRRRHGHQGAAGPARRRRTSRSSQSTSGGRSRSTLLKGRSNYVCRQRVAEVSVG